MKDIHCKSCGRYLCKANGQIVIKCPKCKETNTFKIDSYISLLTASNQKDNIKP